MKREPRKITKVVFYYRLSKPKKGKNKQQTMDTAHGIDAQKADGERLRAQHNAKIIGEYTEIETGTSKRKRPELKKAISHAKLMKATLVIAKLDRLARNVAFTSALMETKVDFVCCDNPEADKFTIHILSAAAEKEALDISTRTKDSLAVAKDKGVKLGSARPGHWKGREHLRGWKAANKASWQARQQTAKDAYSFLIPRSVRCRRKARACGRSRCGSTSKAMRRLARIPSPRSR
jgi:DNA invertase Pin-like site-specific DNA recombinase